MAQSKKTAGATKAAAKRAPAAPKPAAPVTPAPTDPVEPAPAPPPAPEVVTKLEDLDTARVPETGPSDDSKGVRLVSPNGTRVTVEERGAAALKAQGYKTA